jgi:hypothetical protein
VVPDLGNPVRTTFARFMQIYALQNSNRFAVYPKQVAYHTFAHALGAPAVLIVPPVTV